MRNICEDLIRFKIERLVFCLLSRKRYKLHHAGFTLIELIITIAVMGIMTGIATISFSTWQKKSKFESQVREMYSDLVDARTKAFTQKKVHGIVFQPNSYVMKSYSSEVEYKYPADAASSTSGVQIMSKSLKYGITKTNTATAFTADNSAILFDTTGFTSTTPSSSTFGFTIVVNPIDVSSHLNCLVISVARVNMGKWNGSKCDFN